MITALIVILAITGVAFLLYKQAAASVWAISLAIVCLLTSQYAQAGWLLSTLLYTALILTVLGSIKPLRRQFISRPLMGILAKSMPPMSDTEKVALEAGTVSWEGDIFTRQPYFNKLI